MVNDFERLGAGDIVYLKKGWRRATRDLAGVFLQWHKPSGVVIVFFGETSHVTRMSHTWHTPGTSLVKRLSLAMVTRTFVRIISPAVWSEHLNSFAQDSDALLLQHGFVEEENCPLGRFIYIGFFWVSKCFTGFTFKVSLVKDEWSLLLQRRIFKGMFERLFWHFDPLFPIIHCFAFLFVSVWLSDSKSNFACEDNAADVLQLAVPEAFSTSKAGIQSWQSSWNTCSRNILNMEWNILKGKTIPRNINIISCIQCIPFWFYFATNPAWLPNRCQTCSIMKRPEALSMSLKRPNILQTHHHLLGITFHRLDSCHTQRIMELEPSEDSTYKFAVVIKKIPQPKRMAIIWWKRCGTNVFLIFFLEVFFEDSRGSNGRWSLLKRLAPLASLPRCREWVFRASHLVHKCM